MPCLARRNRKGIAVFASEYALPNKGLTHAGVFHADDVFATALLTIINPNITITRSNVVPEGFAGIVYDVGGGEFDHHVGTSKVRENGVPFSSFGLLWRRFGSQLLHEDDARELDKSFVQPIDLADCLGTPCLLSQCVSDFNPRGMSELVDFDKAFWEAVPWARNVLQRRLDALRFSRASVDYVRKCMAEGDGSVLVLSELVPWKGVLVGSGYTYVIYPSLRGGFNVQCVPLRPGDGSMVLPFPVEWRGLPSNELARVSGVKDAVFCHASGYLCVSGSLSGALELARRSMEVGAGNSEEDKT